MLKLKNMKRKLSIGEHLFVAFACYILLGFEFVTYTSILDHPYMIFLIGSLSFVGSYHLTLAILKYFK